MKPEYIVIHHSFTKDNILLADSIAIRRYHTEVNGWADIGYHFVVERIEGIWSVSLGRPWNKAGAHAKECGMNQKSLGVCVVGNFDEEELPIDGTRYLSRFLTALMVNHDIRAKNVIGHRDVGKMAGYDWKRGQFKTCPGILFPMDLVKKMIVGEVPL